MGSCHRVRPTTPRSAPARRPQQLVTRITTALIGLPPLFVLVWIGSGWFTGLVAIAAAIGALELSGMARHWRDRPFTVVAVAGAVALVVGAHFLADASSAWNRAVPFGSAAAGAALFWLLWVPPRKPGASVWVVTVVVALYVGGLLSHAPLLRAFDQGREWVLYLLLVTFATDTCAFLIGRAIGSRPLAPSTSPAKTWEGAVGGVAGAIAASLAIVATFSLDVAIWEAIVLGATVGVVGQLGDLAGSRLKRLAGIKSSGWMLPGHGGLLDRIDSIVFTLVVVYYFVSWLDSAEASPF